MDELDTKVIPKLEKEARDILKEASLIELTIEQHVRELGFSLSGIVSILGKGKWEKKFKARYGAYGDEAYKELWWVKKKLKYHAPIYLRDELKEGKSWLFKRTGERHIWPFNKLKWEKDREVSTAEGTPEDQRWRERAKDLWGKDITAKSAYLKKLGERIFASIEKDKHLISSLYQKTVTGGMATDGGRLKEEADSLQRMAEVICAKKPQFSVKIQAPKSWKIAASKLEQLLKSTAPFKAKITGGTPQYGYIWHWGPTLGNPLDPPHIQVGSNLVLTGTPGKTDFTQTGTGGKSTDIVMAGGFSELASRAASSTPPKPPFDLSYSAGGNATTFYLHVIAIDGRGAMANDYIALELKGAAPPPPPPEQAIEGTVVDAENPDRKIEGARVWATHYPVKGGKQEEAKDKDGKVIEAFSDREGRFTLRGDFKFDVIVYAKKDKTGGAHVDRGGKPAGRPFDCPSPEMKDVVVPIRFTEITHSVISGRVINAATYDPEHPENAEGVEGATVWLTHPGVFMGFTELKKDGKRVETISGKDGRFRFENLRIPPLKIRVGAEKEIEVGAEKKKVSGRSTDPAELGAVPGNDVLIDCPPGSDKVAVPLEMLPRALVVPADNAKPHGFEELKNHTLQYGTHHPPVKAYPGQVIAKHGAPPLAPEQYISAEVDFFLLKERGKRELNWLFDIEHESGERVSDFTAWGFEVAVTGVPEDRHNPYEYKKSSKYNKFTPPEGWVEEHKNSVAFHPYFKIPMDAKPGKYRLILRIADKDLKEVDYNYVELEIKGPVTPAAKPPFEVPPSMTKDIKDNLDKIALIVQGKIGADKELPADMRGIGNHVVEIVAQMIAEIETHNLVVAMKGAMKYRHNPKPSTPRGLNNFEEKRFFGYLQDGRMTIVSMEKFVFGSGKPMEIDTSGKGWMFKTKGMGLDWLVKALLAGNVGAAAEIVKLIDEKKKRFTEYTEKLKEAESKIDVKIHEAYANNDEQLLTLYEKMKACLTNIRQYMESHRVTEGLDVLKMYLGESRDRLMKYIESWRTSSEGSDSLEGWDYRVTGARRREIEELMRKMLGDEKKKELRELKGAALDAELKKLNAQVKAEVERFFSEHRLGLIQAVDEIVAALTKHINELRMQIYSMLPVIERNYAELDKDVKQFNELMRSRAQAGSEIRAA
jgi:hypothetical protein